MIKQESILNHGNGSWGEDRLFVGRDLTFVIDGATPISGCSFEAYHTGAEWMAEEMKRHLAAHSASTEDVPSLCGRFTADTYTRVKTVFPHAQDMPCLTIAAVQKDGSDTCGYVLGDCSIYVLTKTGEQFHLTDQRTAAFYRKTLQTKEDAQKKGLDVAAAVRSQRIKNRAAMNRPQGYWTVAYTGDYLPEFYTFRIPTQQIRAILLCTDGFDRVFFRGLAAPESLLRGEVSLADALTRLRAAEKEHSGDVKAHDDAAAVLLREQ